MNDWKDYQDQMRSIKILKEVYNYNQEVKTKLDIDQKKLFNDQKQTIENKDIQQKQMKIIEVDF